jgi:hypothetical protein
VTVASVLSGLASSLCQWASQVRLVILLSRKEFVVIVNIFNNYR